MPDHYQILQQQIAAAIESTNGTAETLASTDVKLRPLQSATNFAPSFSFFDNDEVADDIGEAPNFVAGEGGQITCGFILHTAGVLGTEPEIVRYLKGCGCRHYEVKNITIDAPSPSDFAKGATYSATGGKAGIIDKATSGGGTLQYIATAGGDLADTDVVTVGSDTANCSGSSSDYGDKVVPRSSDLDTLTIARYIKNFNGTASQDFYEELKGAMGTCSMEWAALDAGRANFTFDGVVNAMAAGSLFTGVSYESLTNANIPKLINATIQVAGVTVRPSSITFDLGNTVELDPDPSTGGGTAGYDQARISKREPTIAIDPYRLVPGTLDDLGTMKAGTEIAFSLIMGSSPNLVELNVEKCQIRENTLGNRAGLETAGLTLAVTRGSVTDWDWEMYFR